MAWLRMRPASFTDLAMVDSKGRWVAESDESSDDHDDTAHRGPRERFDDVSLVVIWSFGEEWELMQSFYSKRVIMMKKISRKMKRRKRMTSRHLRHPQRSYREGDL